MGKTTHTPLLTSLLLLLLLLPPLAFLCFLNYSVTPFLLPVLILVLSSVFLRQFSEKKLGHRQKLARNHCPPFYVLTKTQSSDEDEKRTGQKDESAVESSPGFSSENETAENLGSWDSSSDSNEEEEEDDDDDSLIEIALPDCELKRFSSEKQQQQQQIFPDLYPDFSGSQTGMMELIADLNDMIYEEENFIEIDISMGSIKCPACKIES